jgi:hypothetical protein
MQLTDLFLNELDREGPLTRRVLERVPEGRNEWRPHEKSMPLGALATIVATIPAWLDMVANMDELDINPPAGSSGSFQTNFRTNADLLKTMDDGGSAARAASGNKRRAPRDHVAVARLRKTVAEHPRHVMMRLSINHRRITAAR